MKKREKIWTSLDDNFFPLFSHFLKFDPYSRKPNSFISYIQRQFHAIHNSHLDSCVNTVGDTILMQVEPWFSHEVGKEFLKWENGGVFYYDIGVYEKQYLPDGNNDFSWRHVILSLLRKVRILRLSVSQN